MTQPIVANNTSLASLLGTTLGGYQVRALIGRGASGTVYLAEDLALNRPVALKVLLGSLARNAGMVRAFYREAQAAAPLRHPGIVRIYSAGIESGVPYIAMEYVAGEPLDRYLRRRGTLEWREALYVGSQVADALDCAHAAGVIHRDIKPANIMVDRQGRLRLTDFGIANINTQEAEETPGGAVGTPHYMSPEQCARRELTAATDLYSLGVTLFQIMAGHPPFQAETSEALIKQIAADEAPRLNRLRNDVPDDVARLVAHLLEKDPARRPPSARHVSQTIDRLLAEDGGRSAIPDALSAFVREQAREVQLRVITPPPSPTTVNGRREERARSRWRRPVVMAAAGVSVILTTVAFAAVGAGSSRKSDAHILPAPALIAFAFEPGASGEWYGRLPATGFAFRKLAWSADGRLLVEARGREGTLAHGALGLLAVEPARRACLSPLTPAFEDGGLRYAGPVVLAGPFVIDGHTDPHFLAAWPRADGGAPALAWYPQALGAGAPQNDPVWVTPIPQAKDIPAFGPSKMSAAVHPFGEAIGYARQLADGTCALVEAMRANDRDPIPQPRELSGPSDAPIVPDTIQYTPDGGRVLFMRQRQALKRELWMVSRGAGAPEERLLLVGNLFEGFAISPDGRRVAAAIRGSADEEPELRVIDAVSGSLIARLGPGVAAPGSWLPDGLGLVCVAADDSKTPQMWLVDAAGGARSALTRTRRGGLRSTVAVSRDGRWAAGILNDPAPALVFVPLPARDGLVAAKPQRMATQEGA